MARLPCSVKLYADPGAVTTGASLTASTVMAMVPEASALSDAKAAISSAVNARAYTRASSIWPLKSCSVPPLP
ncbi:hypothetical protein Pla100_60530 [Neorhodopirellula pilleata]|uniref:Uncharacterized protein n=1 Tax=Neorhodopirellula pilleata TaxID=2714738 RepID=A0A5C5ZGZ3_9BACT|nr:hypothetical protein Pla100_60530 [Neorhodopirellula pilleata]